MSARKKRAASKPQRAAKLPDLDAILGAFSDAYSLISVVLKVMDDDEDKGPETMVLRMGVEAFDRAYNRLDEAIIQIQLGAIQEEAS